MKNYKNVFIYGLLIWVVIYVFSLVFSEFRVKNLLLFESIFALVVTISTLFFSVLYFKNIYRKAMNESVKVGVIWFFITIALDLLLYIKGPLAMDFKDYLEDFGLTYLIIPAITIGIGYLIEKRTEF